MLRFGIGQSCILLAPRGQEGTVAVLEKFTVGTRVRIEDLHTHQTLAKGPMHMPQIPTGCPHLLAWEPLCELVAYHHISMSGAIVIWHIYSPAPLMQINLPMRFCTCMVSIFLQGLVAVNTGQEVCIWHPRSGEQLFSIDVSRIAPLCPDNLLCSFCIVPVWDPIGRLLAVIAP